MRSQLEPMRRLGDGGWARVTAALPTSPAPQACSGPVGCWYAPDWVQRASYAPMRVWTAFERAAIPREERDWLRGHEAQVAAFPIHPSRRYGRHLQSHRAARAAAVRTPRWRARAPGAGPCLLPPRPADTLCACLHGQGQGRGAHGRGRRDPGQRSAGGERAPTVCVFLPTVVAQHPAVHVVAKLAVHIDGDGVRDPHV